MPSVSWVVAARGRRGAGRAAATLRPPDVPLSGRWTVDKIRPDMLDDSALRECDESRGTRYSERHSAHYDASPRVDLVMSAPCSAQQTRDALPMPL